MARFLTILLLLTTLPALAVHRTEAVFKNTPQGELKMTIFYPPDWKADDRRPAAIFFFGGGFVNGSTKQFYSKAAYLASRGMVTASAEYRVKNRHQTTPVESFEDCRSAFKWLRANAAAHGIDPARIAAGGGSAGGTCAMNLSEEADARPNLLLLFNPATDVDAPWAPIRNIKPGLPPMVMFYGTEDTHYVKAKPYFQKARELKIPIELYFGKGQKHGFFNDKPGADYSWHASTLYMTDVFLAKHGYLQGKPTIAQPAASKAVLFMTPLAYLFASSVVLDHARIAVAVRNKHATVGSERDVCGAAELLRGIRNVSDTDLENLPSGGGELVDHRSVRVYRPYIPRSIDADTVGNLEHALAPRT